MMTCLASSPRWQALPPPSWQLSGPTPPQAKSPRWSRTGCSTTLSMRRSCQRRRSRNWASRRQSTTRLLQRNPQAHAGTVARATAAQRTTECTPPSPQQPHLAPPPTLSDVTTLCAARISSPSRTAAAATTAPAPVAEAAAGHRTRPMRMHATAQLSWARTGAARRACMAPSPLACRLIMMMRPACGTQRRWAGMPTPSSGTPTYSASGPSACATCPMMSAPPLSLPRCCVAWP